MNLGSQNVKRGLIWRESIKPDYLKRLRVMCFSPRWYRGRRGSPGGHLDFVWRTERQSDRWNGRKFIRLELDSFWFNRASHENQDSKLSFLNFIVNFIVHCLFCFDSCRIFVLIVRGKNLGILQFNKTLEKSYNSFMFINWPGWIYG